MSFARFGRVCAGSVGWLCRNGFGDFGELSRAVQQHGIWSSRNRKTKLKRCQEILGAATTQEASPTPVFNWADWLCELTGIDPRVCPKCGKGRMVTKEILPAFKVVPKTG